MSRRDVRHAEIRPAFDIGFARLNPLPEQVVMPTRRNRPVGTVISEGEMAHRFRTMAANTTARGYGAPHAAERKRRLPQHTEHDPCGYCGRPLGPNRTAWHLPHNTTRTAYLPGFWHARCNIRAAAIEGNRRQATRRRRAQSRTW